MGKDLPSQIDLSSAFYTTDRQLVITSVSDGALTIWGKTRPQVVGLRLLEVFPFLAGSDILNAHREALRTFRPLRFTTTSHFLPGLVDVEIYPIAEGLQVRYWRATLAPVHADLRAEPDT